MKIHENGSTERESLVFALDELDGALAELHRRATAQERGRAVRESHQRPRSGGRLHGRAAPQGHARHRRLARLAHRQGDLARRELEASLNGCGRRRWRLHPQGHDHDRDDEADGKHEQQRRAPLLLDGLDDGHRIPLFGRRRQAAPRVMVQ